MTDNINTASPDAGELALVLENAGTLAENCWQTGQFDEAEKLWQAMLSLSPANPDANYGLGMNFLRLGKAQKAYDAFVIACEGAPEIGKNWLGLIESLILLTRFSEAKSILEQTVAAGLDHPDVERLAEVIKESEKKLTLRQQSGNVLAELQSLAERIDKKQRGRDDQGAKTLCSQIDQFLNNKDYFAAERTCRLALSAFPSSGKLWHSLGISYLMLKDYRLAQMVLSSALELQPRNADCWNGKGVAERVLGHLQDAESCFKKCLSLMPGHVNALINLGNLRHDQGLSDQAIACFEAALIRSGKSVSVLVNLATVYAQKGDLIKSIELLGEAKKVAPDVPEVYLNLGIYLQRQGLLRESVEEIKKAIALDPVRVEARLFLARAQRALMDFSNAFATLRQAMAMAPDDLLVWGEYLFLLVHVESVSPEDEMAEYCRYGSLLEKMYPRAKINFPIVRDKGKVLKVGVISADLREHAVATFVEPIFKNLLGSDIEFHVYSNASNEDKVSNDLKKLVRSWVNIFGQSSDWVIEKIMSNQIDIILDLSGHTAGSRMDVLARKPAPIQVSWIGFPATTGMSVMDYYLSDEHLAPSGMVDHLFVEKIVRLPASCVFQPYLNAPPQNELPAKNRGRFTFGSFAALRKINEASVVLWARALNAVPDSILVLAGLVDSQVNDQSVNALLKQFEIHGIQKSRVTVLQRTNTMDYLARHHDIDLVLDTFPFTGGTTTCHALWMGVPVLTLFGRTVASRPSACINIHAGVPEFNVSSEEEFVKQAVFWATHLELLADKRRKLRNQVASSLICQPDVMAQSLRAAFRTMWRYWCDGQEAKSFSVVP